jgi:hypothetical protein
MAMAPSNNPMRAVEEELWGEEPIVTSSASAPALQEHQDMSAENHQGTVNERKTSETTRGVHQRRSGNSTIDRRHNLFHLQILSRRGSINGISKSCKKDSSEETEEVKKLFQTLGHLSISDAAFALQPFTGSSHCGDQAEKWLEQFSRYVAFKKLTEDDQLQLFQLLMKDQAADWLTSLPRFRKDDIHVLKDEFMKRHQMTRVEKWRQTADIWKRRQGLTEPVDDYIAAMQAAARRVKMAQFSLADAVIQGLRPEIRLHV